MYIFNIISLLGGLALFLYGMRLMGNNLKEGQSGTLKVIMGKVTDNPVKAFILGLFVTAVIQSSTATIVITSGLVATGIISLNQSLGIIVGVYLGDCVTTAIVCSIGAKTDSKRVGFVNIIFNLGKTLLVLVVVFVIHKLGLLNGIWDMHMNSGSIANANTVFNLVSAVILLPFMKLFSNLSCKIVKDEVKPAGKYDDKIAALNPCFLTHLPSRSRDAMIALMPCSRFRMII
ncbi:MAG: Na/Pi symporter [Lachnospiraceae bacterium]|nr:Na/Pi symporter [Lachnospiraceae bacterium]